MQLDDLAGMVGDGCLLAVPPDYSGCAMTAVRALMRRRVRGLHLLAVPQGGFQVDMLIGAGCVETLEAAAVTLGERGQAPRFTAALKAGRLRMLDATCPVIHAGLQAAEKGIPFMPLRGILGSDLVDLRPEWKTIDNPYGNGDPLLLLPAIRPQVSLFHVPLADRHGNAWIGVRRELMLMAHASQHTLVTAEEIADDDLLADERMAAGTIPSLYVTAIAHAPRGAWPVGLFGRYPADEEALAAYTAAAASEEGFARWCARHVDDAGADTART